MGQLVHKIRRRVPLVHVVPQRALVVVTGVQENGIWPFLEEIPGGCDDAAQTTDALGLVALVAGTGRVARLNESGESCRAVDVIMVLF